MGAPGPAGPVVDIKRAATETASIPCLAHCEHRVFDEIDIEGQIGARSAPHCLSSARPDKRLDPGVVIRGAPMPGLRYASSALERLVAPPEANPVGTEARLNDHPRRERGKRPRDCVRPARAAAATYAVEFGRPATAGAGEELLDATVEHGLRDDAAFFPKYARDCLHRESAKFA